MAYSELVPTTNEAQTIVETALRSAAPTALETGKVYVLNTPIGVKQIDLTGDEYRDTPRRKTGHTTVRDAESFLAYYTKHHDEDSELYSDVQSLTVTAVLDANRASAPRFGDHRLTLELRQTKAWKEWTTASGKMYDQETFANFLEDHLPNLIDPDAATMLEIAQSIQASTKGTFLSGTRLSSGERKLVYTEDTTAKAGSRGELTIPEVFEIAVMPFEGAPAYKVRARFRYRIANSALALGFKLEQPEDRAADAFNEVVRQIQDAVTVPVVNGTPG